MNTTLSTRPSQEQLDQHHQQHSPQEQPRLTRRLRLIDRLALHLGLALIAWGRRPRSLESRERRANRIEQAIARDSRKLLDERTARLLLPIR